ncbi:hypothetical protein BGW80DRAFT_1453401 [Lactifluus volemus]|nr:hypothetical protein BGW80DRAFT_1453401 [Lactifluus volemus]
MSPIPPPDPTSFALQFLPGRLAALRKHLDEEHLILGSRELIQNNFYELSLDGNRGPIPRQRDYGREQDDRIVMAFSRPSNMPLLPPQPSSAPPSSNAHSMSKDSVATHSQPVKVPFAISFISQSHLRVIAPPLHLTPAILQTVRGSWPRGVVSEKKVAENVYEFKLKGYRWFQEDTFATDSLRHVLSLLGTWMDLWVFTGPIPPEYPSSTPPGSRTDLQTTPPDKAHTRAMTESSIARPSHSSVSGLNSHKSGVVRKPAPRAQLPVSVAHTSSNDNVDTPNPRPTEFRMEMQSSIGSAVDMTGVGTQKYPRPGESDIGRSQQAPFGSYIMTPGANPRYFSSMSASVLKASQPSESVQGAQSLEQTTGRTDTPSNKRETIPSPVIPRPRPSPVKATPQPGTPIPPLLGPGAFRDSLSSNTGQTVDGPNAWTGVARENGHASGSAHDRDPKDNVLPGGWIPTSSRNKESKGSGDYADEPNAHLHNSTSPYKLTPEEQEVKVSVPEVVHPRSRLPKSGEATIVAEAPRDADINRAVGQTVFPYEVGSRQDW